MDELVAMIQVMGRLERICRQLEQENGQLRNQIEALAPEPGATDAKL